MKSNEKPKNETPGVIEPGRLYRLDEFLARLGLGQHAWRTMKKKNLPVTELCGRKFVAADEFLEWVKKSNEE